MRASSLAQKEITKELYKDFGLAENCLAVREVCHSVLRRYYAMEDASAD